MDDVRWLAPDHFCRLPVSRLRQAGLRIATEGDAPARLVVAMDGANAITGYRYASRIGCPLLMYLWDIPHWHVEQGRPNRIAPIGGRLMSVPRLFGSVFPRRHGYYSRVRYAARHAQELWVPSAQSHGEIQRLFGANGATVPYCYDSDRFHRGVGWRKPAEPVVLTISRLVPYKNHAAVIRAAALIKPRPRVHIIGRGPEASQLRELASRLGVALQLDEQRLSDAAVVDAYLAASVVVCPSRFEGIGLTPLEGAALGIPTIASDIPTHREFCGSEVRLLALDDDRLMAQEIERALQADRAAPAEPRNPFPEMTMDACVARFLPRLEAMLRGG